MPPRSLRLIKTLWGIDEPISTSLCQSIKTEGYFGVELIRLAWSDDASKLVDLVNQAGLALVCQVHTTGGFIQDGDYVYCDSYSVEEHKSDFSKQLQECSKIIDQVKEGGFVNVHAGVDAWNTDEALDFLRFALEEVSKTNKAVTFETHRQRLFGSPFQTREILRDNSLAALKLNADLSHWYCACERVFDPSENRDATWWPEFLEVVLANHCHYIHARFGWSQGPQMADPSAVECEKERSLQEGVWKTLLTEMVKRDADCYLQPEYGPYPYMPVQPGTQTPVASLPNAVSFTKGRIEKIFSEVLNDMS